MICYRFSKIYFKEKFHHILLVSTFCWYQIFPNWRYLYKFWHEWLQKIYDLLQCDFKIFSEKRRVRGEKRIFIKNEASKKLFHYKRWLTDFQWGGWVKASSLLCAKKNSFFKFSSPIFNRFYTWLANGRKERNVTANWHKCIASSH